MIGLTVLLFPLLLLGFMLFMQRVEDPLNRADNRRDMETFLDNASPAEMDSLVREGTDSALARFRHRVRGWRRRPN